MDFKTVSERLTDVSEAATTSSLESGQFDSKDKDKNSNVISQSSNTVLEAATADLKSEHTISYNADFEKTRLNKIEKLKKKMEEEDEYNKAVNERRHKRLMHLVQQSQFYVNNILHRSNVKVKRKKQKQHNLLSLTKRPKLGSVKDNTQYDIVEFISKENLKDELTTKTKNKAVSDQDVQDYLSLSSDEENINPNSKPADQLEEEYRMSEYFIGELYDFQKVGVNWLLSLYKNGLNGILADEMGLGKTVQVIALIAQLLEREKKVQDPFLIVVPLSTLSNWMTEFERFAPVLKTVIYYDRDRTNMRNDIKKYRLPNGHMTMPVIITTYETVLSDIGFLLKFTYSYVIVDEGQRIKNPYSQLSKCLKKIKSMNRLLLTGTPLQNNLRELWSLLNFLLPEIFNDLDLFESWFDVRILQSVEGRAQIMKMEEDKGVITSLRDILQPFMLRRMKDEVLLQIPPKKEIIVFCPLTELQHTLYRAILKREYQELKMVKEESLIVDIDNKRPLRSCRMIKEHPEMIKEKLKTKTTNIDKWKLYADVDSRNQDYFIRLVAFGRVINYRKVVNHPYLIHHPKEFCMPLIDENIVKLSGKMMILDRMLSKLHADGHKVLLFSCWTQILDVIEDYLTLRPYNYCRLDGHVQLKQRAEDIKQFNNDSSYFLYLITTRSGGVGLNLMGADTVIIYDCDWNPQVDIQAMARCHRVGQTRPVMIYKFCTKGTIDEEILYRGEAKRKLEKAVISKVAAVSSDTVNRLLQILESTNDNIVRVDEQAITDVELEKLLDRSELLRQMKK